MNTETVFPTNRATPLPLRIAPCMRRETARLIDHDRHYVPVLVTCPEHRFLQSAGFSLADMEMDAGYRLQLLVNFIRRMSTANPKGGYISCSYRIVEQIAYLSYWKDLTLEFQLEVIGRNHVVRARFPREPELTCILDVLPGGDGTSQSHEEIQKWFDFLCQVVREHARIWQIHLIADRSIFARLTPDSDRPDVFVEMMDDEE